MNQYTCKRCGFQTKAKCHLISHLRRKNQCEALLEDIDNEVLINELIIVNVDGKYLCKYCSRRFNNRGNKYKHELICKKKIIEDTQTNKTEVEMEKMLDRIQLLERKLLQLNQQHVTNNISITNNHNNVDNKQINNNIVNQKINKQVNNIKNFGSENIDYLTKDFLNSCLLTNNIVPLIENIHFDKEHPENHNVKLKSTKQELMETYIDGKWIITDTDETLNELINRGYRVLTFHSRSNKKNIIDTEMDEEEYDDVMEWLERIYEDKKVRKPIKKQLLLLFMNNKTMLLEKME
jgi:hypothetical protein